MGAADFILLAFASYASLGVAYHGFGVVRDEPGLTVKADANWKKVATEE